MVGHGFRGQWVLAHWFVRSCSHSLRVSPLHVGFMDFSRSHQGEERAQIPAEFRARVFKPLGVSDALREGLKTTSGGRLASSPGV